MLNWFLMVLLSGLLVYLFAGMAFIVGLFISRHTRSGSKPFVSVIIAARNEESSIQKCLDSVLHQSYPADRFEVIVVNDRSTDKMGAIIEEMRSRHESLQLITIRETPAGYSPKKWALQTGVESSRGDILMFTDADCTVGQAWIETVLKYFSDDTGMVIGFSSIEGKSVFENLQAVDFLALMTCACGACNLGFSLSASGQNLAYRRKAFDDAGGFLPVMKRLSGDDVLMVQQIRKKTTWRIVFSADENSFSVTAPAANFSRLIHQRTRWASNATAMIKLNPAFLAYLSCVYVFHAALFAGLFLSFISGTVLLMTAFAWLNKWIIDLTVIVSGSRMFKKKFSFPLFLLWFVCQTPYVLWVGFKGSFGLFKWK